MCGVTLANALMWTNYVHTKTVTVRDLRNNFSKVETWLGEGEKVIVEDILHVATALHLAAEQFLTFDGKKRSLAEAEGMVVPV